MNHLAIWRDTVNHLALVLVPLVGLLLVSAHPLIVLLFTAQYAAAVPIFMIWSLAILPAILTTDAVLRVYAQTRFLLLLSVIRLGVIVLLIHWAMATFHLAGAVMLTVLAAFLTKVLAVMRVARVMKVRPAALVPWASVGGIVVAASVAGVIARLVGVGLSWPALPALMMTAGVYAGIYVGLLWLLGVMTVTNKCVVLRASSA